MLTYVQKRPINSKSNFVTAPLRFNAWPRGRQDKYLLSIKIISSTFKVRVRSFFIFFYSLHLTCVTNTCESCQRKRAKQIRSEMKRSFERTQRSFPLAQSLYFFGRIFPEQCPKGFCVNQNFLKDTESNKCRIILRVRWSAWQVYKQSEIQSKHRGDSSRVCWKSGIFSHTESYSWSTSS